MKKIIILITALFCCAGGVTAQDILSLYPIDQGGKMVDKTYDANGRLLGTTTYTVLETYDNPRERMDIGFTMTDTNGQVINNGAINITYENGAFYMSGLNMNNFPDITKYLSAQTEIVGEFLDYPDMFDEAYPPRDSEFAMDGGNILVRNKNDRKEYVKVQVENRNYTGMEKVTTPAGTFDAHKIKFEVDVYDNDTKISTTYKGVEWYAAGHGIVRTEIYDPQERLMNYTVLTYIEE